MASESVRIWRPDDASSVLLMAGRTTAYAVEPRDEYVFGVVTGRPMCAFRGRERHLVSPGHVVAWDPTGRHAGRGLDGRPWDARLMVIDAAELRRLAGDEDNDATLDELVFPDPVIRDPRLATGFAHMHRAMEQAPTRLEADERLTAWLRSLMDTASLARRSPVTSTPRDNRALRKALDHLAEQPEHNIGLDELAAVAGIGKFRLMRLFRQQVGVSPHALHIAHRIRAARRMLEAGEPIAQVAAATGFADQSHLHRHFTRSLGMTPGDYQRRLA
jgi:AraC-like DNA-binding protein